LALARRSRPSRRSVVAAVPVAGFACWLLGDALVQFQRAGTTVDPISPDHASALVVGGANRVSRNPMYLGMATALLAHAVARRSAAALAPVGGFVAVLTVGQIAAEERALADRFGDGYARYRGEVPRWVDARSFVSGLTLLARRSGRRTGGVQAG
jgi:protein-S-isoprenylcysteine O-methyltransferase Ste14